MLLLPEGQMGEASEPSKKPMLFRKSAALSRRVLSFSVLRAEGTYWGPGKHEFD